MPTAPIDPHSRIRARALELGFDVMGVAAAAPLDRDYEHYRAFVAAGMHGEMAWLAENAETRRGVAGPGILDGARSVICVARRYQRVDDASDPPFARLVARYARGRDYHNFLRKKLRRLADFVRAFGTPEAPIRARPMCDDAPILERAWAARAGLGFVGKNGLVITPGLGSLLLLGEVVSNLELPPDLPMTERCGACTRCLDACPTRAFVAPWVLDPRRCISYLTIEQRGPIPDELRRGVGEHLFGCDDCQTVCPFNASPRTRVETEASPFAPYERWSSLDLVSVLEADDEAFRALADGSPLFRATREGLARNAAIVLGNRRDPDALPALRRAAAEDASPVVREAAMWAIGECPAE